VLGGSSPAMGEHQRLKIADHDLKKIESKINMHICPPLQTNDYSTKI
jgi:hypothetical protein